MHLPIYIPRCIHSYSIHTYIHQNHDADTRQMTLHDQISHVAPLFDHCDLKHAVFPLMLPSVSHDADTGANGITCIHTCLPAFIFIYMHTTCMHGCTQKYIHSYICTYKYTDSYFSVYTYTSIYTCKYTYIPLSMYGYIHTYMVKYIHT